MARKPQRRSFGSVTEVIKSKKYVVRWMENTDAGRRRRSHTVRGTRKDAETYLARMQLEHADEKRVPTVGEAYESWFLPWAEKRVADGAMSARTLQVYKSGWNSCASAWKDTPVDAVSPLDVQKWLSGLAKSQALMSVKVLRKVMDFAVKYEAVRSNKFRVSYDMPTRSMRTRSKRVMGLAECVEAWEAVRGTIIEPCFLLAAFGSCRVGESCAPMTSDVTELDGWAVVRIDKQMPNRGSDVPTGRLKTLQSVRDVILPPPYSTRLLEIAEERRAFGTEWLCDRGDGTPVRQHELNAIWSRLVPDMPFKNLRNSWRTFAQYEWGIDYDTCELLMGHKLPGVTGNHYLRPSTEQLLNKIADALKENVNLT